MNFVKLLVFTYRFMPVAEIIGLLSLRDDARRVFDGKPALAPGFRLNAPQLFTQNAIGRKSVVGVIKSRNRSNERLINDDDSRR